MLNLKAMAVALESETAHDEARSLRQLQAQSALSRGAVLLGLAAADDYRDRALVLEACDLMLDAIQTGRGQIEPYLHLAHVFIVFRDDRQALKYLGLARELEPDHPDVMLYYDFLTRAVNGEGEETELVSEAEASLDTPPQDSLPAPWQTDSADFDRAYDELEQEIYAQVRRAMSSDLVLLSPSAEACEPLRGHVTRLAAEYERIQLRLRQLEAEFDVLELSRKLKPMEVLLRRVERVLVQSERLTELSQRLASLGTQADTLLRDLAGGDTLTGNARLEALMDACDLVANELDELDDARVPIAPLLRRYEQLIETVTQLQDELE